MAAQFRLLPLWARFYVYGLQGVFTELVYTALWDLYFIRSPKLIGVSSIWAFFIYAFALMFIEKIYRRLAACRLPLLLRGLVYLVCIYAWEFSTGYALKLFDACPWNYEPVFDWHFRGLVTLEYVPLWYFASIIAETILIPYASRMHVLVESNKA